MSDFHFFSFCNKKNVKSSSLARVEKEHSIGYLTRVRSSWRQGRSGQSEREKRSGENHTRGGLFFSPFSRRDVVRRVGATRVQARIMAFELQLFRSFFTARNLAIIEPNSPTIVADVLIERKLHYFLVRVHISTGKITTQKLY